MSRIEELQQQIAELESELHDLQVVEWWQQRPHILEFECNYEHQYSDDGDFNDYFHAHHVILNHAWIAANGVKWQTFCDNLGIPLYPIDEDEIAEYWEEYLRDITDYRNYNVDYPDFTEHSGQILKNPNYV